MDLSPLLVPACGGDDDDDPPPPANNPPTASVTTPTGEQSNDVTISYTLTDADGDSCSITVEYSTNGGTSFSTATAGTGGDGTTALTASPTGTAHTFVWDSSSVGTASIEDDVQFRITPNDGDAGTASTTSNFTVWNGTNTKATVSVSTPSGTQMGDVTVNYTLTDPESDTVNILVEYSTNAGSSYATATEAAAGSQGVTGLTSSSLGTSHHFVWNSSGDGVGTSASASVLIRITPTDTVSGVGTPDTTFSFTVDNTVANTVPSVTIAPLTGTQSGLVSINYDLIDAESNPCSLAVRYSLNGGTSFTSATMGTGGAGVLALPSAPTPGIPTLYVWDTVADGVALTAAETAVQIELTPTDTSTGSAVTTASFTVDNTTNSRPTVVFISSYTSEDGLIIVDYTLTDADNDTCSVTIEYSLNSGTQYFTTSAGPCSEGITNLTAASTGTNHRFVWNSFLDGVALAGPVTTARIQITPSDGLAGTAVNSGDFTLDNSGHASGAATNVTAFPVQEDTTGSAETYDAAATDGHYLYLVGRGYNTTSSSDEWVIQKRYFEDGALVGAFGTGGVETSDPTTRNDEPSAIKIDSTYMYVGGIEDATTTGTGTVAISSSSTAVVGTGTAFTTELVVGSRIEVNGDDRQVTAIADDTNLTVNSFFNSTVSGQTLYIRNRAWRIEKRTLSTGALVTAFGTSGAITSVSVGDGPGVWMDIDSTHMYLVSVTQVTAPNDYALRMEKRSLTDGSLDTNFGTSGVVTQNLSTLYADGGLNVVRVGSYLYVSGCYGLNIAGPGNAVATIERRSTSTGALDTGWATSGVFSDDTSVGADIGTAIVSDGTDLYWLTKTETTTANNFNWRIIKVNIATPATTSAVTSTALVLGNQGPPVSGGMVIVGSHLYVLSTNSLTDYEWRLEKRLLTTLALDTTFATSGVYTSNPNTGAGGTGIEDEPQALLETGGVLFLIGREELMPNWDMGRRIEAIFR